jgi:excisionase family DNA binding protein
MRNSVPDSKRSAPAVPTYRSPDATFAGSTPGDTLIEAIADAVAHRLERLQTTRKRLLTLEHAAEYLGMSDDTVERLVASGRLVPVRGLDRRIRFDIRDLDRLIEESKRAKV